MPFGVLSGREIHEAHKRYIVHNSLKGVREGVCNLIEREPRIWIDDFDVKRLNPNSYNLRLADELLVYKQYAGTVPANGQPLYDNKHQNPEADICLDMKDDNPTTQLTIPEQGLTLRPGVLYLGRTMEYTETHNVVPCIEGRSSIARLGMSVHITAGYGDVGFCGTWTLEITVVHPIRVYAGVEVCQINYATISPNHEPYKSKKYQGQRGVVASRLHMDLNQKE